MTTDLQQQIDQYFTVIQSMSDSITDMQIRNYSTVFKTLSFIGILDTLAKCTANPRFKPYERFTSFIESFCEWQDCSKVSLPHLVKFLKLVPSMEFEKLRQYANSKYANWQLGSIIYIDQDPSYDEIFKLWPKDNDHREPIEKVSLKHLTHLSLLWKLRNSIVHELRKPGYGMDALIDNNPGYHGMQKSIDDPTETWELVYPINFFQSITNNGIKNLKMYCMTNKLNPYDYYKFGSYWLEELN